MNRINLQQGGHPLNMLSDIMFMQDAYTSAFTALAHAHKNAILSGCRITITLSGWAMTSGYVSINGEIYQVDAQSWDISNISDPAFVPIQTVDTGTDLSPVLYADGSFKDVHLRRRARIEHYASQATKIRVFDMADMVGEFFEVQNTATTGNPMYYTPSGIWVKPSGTMLSNGHETLKICRNGNYLEFKGSCQCSGFANNSIIMTLPNVIGARKFIPDYRRALTVAGIISDGTGYSQHTMLVDVKPNGEVSVTSGTYSSDGALALVFNHKVPLF